MRMNKELGKEKDNEFYEIILLNYRMKTDDAEKNFESFKALLIMRTWTENDNGLYWNRYGKTIIDFGDGNPVCTEKKRQLRKVKYDTLDEIKSFFEELESDAIKYISNVKCRGTVYFEESADLCLL